MSRESELMLPHSQYLWDQTELTTTALQCSETGAQAASESHQHQAHRRAWVSPPWLYLRTRPPSYLGDHLQPLPGSFCCSTGKQGSWPVPLATFRRGSQQSVGCPQSGLAAWLSTLMAMIPLSNFSLPIPATPAHAGNRSRGQTLSPKPNLFLYQMGMPREGDALSEVT